MARGSRHHRHLAVRLLALAAALLPTPARPAPPPPAALPDILILESYHRGFPWTDQETNGALAALRARWPALQPQVESLDRKRYGTPEALEAAVRRVAEKLRGRRLDGVIVTDNAALEVALARRADLLGAAPISFAGVNGFDPAWLRGQPHVTGVVEDVDVAGTLALVRALQPDLRQLVVALDRTETSAGIEAQVRAAAAGLPPGATLRVEADLSMTELEALAAGLDRRSALLLGSFNRDRLGDYYGYEQVADRVTARSGAPVYALWDFQLGHGVLGGSLLSGEAQGRRAAELLLRLMDGEQDVPVDHGAAPWLVVDEAVADRLGLDLASRPPPGPATVLNARPGAWESHRTLLSVLLALVASLAAFASVLLWVLRRIRRGEQALRESEERYRSIVDSVDDAIFVHDPDGGAILDVNRRAEEMYGLPREVLLRDGLAPLCQGEPPFTVEDAARWLERARTAGTQRFEWHARRGDGELFWVEVATRPATLSGRRRLVVAVRHIGERKEAERALQESERRFREMANLLPQVVYEADAQGRLTFVNRQAFEAFRYTPEELERGRELSSFVVPQDRPRAARNMGAVMAGAGGVGNEYTALRRDGSTFPVAIYSSPIMRDGRVAGLRGRIVDISGRQRAEEERLALQRRLDEAQRLEAIGRLAGGVAHDFNNLLTPILGEAEAALEALGPGHAVAPELQAILEAAGRAGALTRQLLAFGRRQVLQERLVDLNAEVTSLHAMLRRVIGEDVEVRLALAAGPVTVTADPAQIQQVLLNLAINARDAMPSGGVLTLATRVIPAEGEAARDQAELTVTDTGHGMAEEVRARIFEPFFTTKAPGRGTGLGLATVLGVVQQHGGTVEVRSAPGQGAAFQLRFPLATGAPQPADRGAALPPSSAPAGPLAVLLAEDEPAVRRLVEGYLRAAGHTVLVAASGEEALAQARARPDRLDLLVTDVVMPGMNGRQLHEALLALHPGLPVVFMSGYPALPGTQEEIVAGGPGAVLAKPFTREDLLRRVAGAVGARPAGDAGAV